ncbi:CatB-related O-acetyltransferase [Rickettsia conorii]|uniref:CatB-related O-acetyltransferase n=1 Tax=Rickettsia conorii TaxID=781 RepID=UPI003AF040F8
MTNHNSSYPHLFPKQAKETIFLKHFIHNPNIIVGDYTYYNDANHPEKFEYENVRGAYFVKLIIGKFCAIAMGTSFISDDMNHPMDGFSTYTFFIFENLNNYTPSPDKRRDTVIGNDVWFGTNSTILPGVNIGDEAIIGACSVVAKDVPPYSIVIGNPTKIVRYRFPDEIVEQLLEIKWWDWDYDKITWNIPAIVGADIEKLKQAE